MPRPYRPLAVANEFIMAAASEGADHMKLQKLVYYVHGWWLKYYEDSIISEAPQVWQHGPVFKSLYHALKHFGSAPIRLLQNDNPFSMVPRIDEFDRDVLNLVSWVWGRYGGYSSFDLSEMTHAPGTPWRRMAETHHWAVPRNTDIPADLIREAFQKEAEDLGIRDK